MRGRKGDYPGPAFSLESAKARPLPPAKASVRKGRPLGKPYITRNQVAAMAIVLAGAWMLLAGVIPAPWDAISAVVLLLVVAALAMGVR